MNSYDVFDHLFEDTRIPDRADFRKELERRSKSCYEIVRYLTSRDGKKIEPEVREKLLEMLGEAIARPTTLGMLIRSSENSCKGRKVDFQTPIASLLGIPIEKLFEIPLHCAAGMGYANDLAFCANHFDGEARVIHKNDFLWIESTPVKNRSTHSYIPWWVQFTMVTDSSAYISKTIHQTDVKIGDLLLCCDRLGSNNICIPAKKCVNIREVEKLCLDFADPTPSERLCMSLAEPLFDDNLCKELRNIGSGLEYYLY